MSPFSVSLGFSGHVPQFRPRVYRQFWVFILSALLGRHQGDLAKNMIRRRLLGGEPQLQVTDDPVHDGILREKSGALA
jgi:hypothetical protein